jgi:hypothetical protein
VLQLCRTLEDLADFLLPIQAGKVCGIRHRGLVESDCRHVALLRAPHSIQPTHALVTAGTLENRIIPSCKIAFFVTD